MAEPITVTAYMDREVPVTVLETDEQLAGKNGYHLVVIPKMSEEAYLFFREQLEVYRSVIVQAPSDDDAGKEASDG